MLKTYGLEMYGLEEAANETKLIRKNSGHTVQISYDKSTDEVLSTYFMDGDSRVTYRDGNVIRICNACGALTAQKIADMIAERLGIIPMQD